MRKNYITILIAGASMLTGVAFAQETDTDQAPAQTPAEIGRAHV